LRELKIPAHVKVLPVVRFGRKTPIPCLPACCRGPSAASASWPIGDGLRNSRGRRKSFSPAGCRRRIVVEAIHAVRPFGVDVSSGVEEVPGIKDPEKIYEFVRAARVAAARLEHDSMNSPLRADTPPPAFFPTSRGGTARSAAAMCPKRWCRRSIGYRRASHGI